MIASDRQAGGPADLETRSGPVRLLATLLLSLPGGIAAFFLTLAALDTEWPDLFSGEPQSRVAAFAAPGLGQAAADGLGTLRPIPVAIEAGLASLPPARPGTPQGSQPARSKTAWVPPIVRRMPAQPEATPEAVPPTATVVADAKPAPVARPTAPSAPLDSTTRSALGGPRGVAIAAPRPAAKAAATPVRAPAQEAAAPVKRAATKRIPAVAEPPPGDVGTTP